MGKYKFFCLNSNAVKNEIDGAEFNIFGSILQVLSIIVFWVTDVNKILLKNSKDKFKN